MIEGGAHAGRQVLLGEAVVGEGPLRGEHLGTLLELAVEPTHCTSAVLLEELGSLVHVGDRGRRGGRPGGGAEPALPQVQQLPNVLTVAGKGDDVGPLEAAPCAPAFWLAENAQRQ